MSRCAACSSLVLIALFAAAVSAEDAKLNVPPPGYEALFNGKDLTGWKGLVGDPKSRAKMSAEELAEKQKKADESAKAHWSVKEGIIVFDGKGQNLCSAKNYGDFELFVDWKIEKNGDSGIYLRGMPQVQIWDPGMGGQNAVGSGGLYNNKMNPSKPLVKADNPIGEWNTFWIKMVGDKVTVKLNGQLVVDNTTLEDYQDSKRPIPASESIELQNHGNTLYFRNIYVKELPRKE